MLGDNTKFTPGPLLRYFIDYLNRLLQFRAYTNEPISYEKDVKIDEEIKTLISVMSVLHKMERRTRLIAQYNKRGVLVGVFGSSKDAEILTGVSQGQINKLTSPSKRKGNKRKTAGGYYWKPVKDFNNIPEKIKI